MITQRMICSRLVSLVALACSALCLQNVNADDQTLRADAASHFGVLTSPDPEQVRAAAAELGRALFWDRRLSADGKTACASCHLAEDYGADRRAFSVDARGKQTKRNSQTVLNSMGQSALRWTANRKNGAEQAERSLTGSMGLASREAAVDLMKRLDYQAAFQRAFPDDVQPLSAANYGRAIEAYEDTLTTPAPFDKFLAGDDQALSPLQKSGLTKFIEIGCATCHSGALLGGHSLEKFGQTDDYWTLTGSARIDEGRFDDTQREEDKYVFRVSMLRNIDKTAPYFHDGSVTRLNDAVQIMAKLQLGTELSDQDTDAIVAFLKSLTGDVPRHFAPPGDIPR